MDRLRGGRYTRHGDNRYGIGSFVNLVLGRYGGIAHRQRLHHTTRRYGSHGSIAALVSETGPAGDIEIGNAVVIGHHFHRLQRSQPQAVGRERDCQILQVARFGSDLFRARGLV